MHLVKMSPPHFRKIVNIPKIQMATTLGFVLLAMSQSRKSKYHSESSSLAKRILAKQNADGGWGYEFDVVLRWGSYKAGSSNLIATAICVKALKASDQLGVWEVNAKKFIESTFWGGYFGYSKPKDPLIHNANLLGATALHALNGSSKMIKEAISRTVSSQNEDGSWYYGEDSNLEWVDNFHTVYILESLMTFLESESEVRAAIERGVAFWQSEMFIGGLPKYFLQDQTVSKDINTLSSALTLVCNPLFETVTKDSLLLSTENLLHQLQTTLESTPKPAPYFRWDYGPAVLALASVERRE
jgi:hypothetical protein